MTSETTTTPVAPPANFSRVRAYLQLLRAPNVFTAMADVLMGYLFTHPSVERPLTLLLLLACSSSLYLAGMVLNDVFDVAQDAAERPHRPIPSGRVSLGLARVLGYELLIVGMAFGFAASYFGGSLRPGLLSVALAAMVWSYDAVLKRTFLGPVGMGACRTINVLLGMSLGGAAFGAPHWLVASGIGVYIVGVTWFARTEARESNRLALAASCVVMALGIGLLAAFPNALLDAGGGIMLRLQTWHLLMGLLAAMILWRCVRAILHPEPPHVQAAVKNCIISLITLNAVVVLAVHGSSGPGVPWALVVLVLSVPTLFLGRWIYST